MPLAVTSTTAASNTKSAAGSMMCSISSLTVSVGVSVDSSGGGAGLLGAGAGAGEEDPHAHASAPSVTKQATATGRVRPVCIEPLAAPSRRYFFEGCAFCPVSAVSPGTGGICSFGYQYCL